VIGFGQADIQTIVPFRLWMAPVVVRLPAQVAPLHAPRPPFGLPEVPVAVRTSRLSSSQAGKALIFTPVRESSGECGLSEGGD
jgi:hypothetical protein